MSKITVCCIKGCEDPIRSVGLCSKHYNKWNLYGHPLVGELDGFAVPRLPLKKEKAAYSSMKMRCYNPQNRQYSYWGGRGVRVCDRWLLSFDNFYADMGDAPEGSSLERKDVNGNYEPDNCKWATVLEQNRNQTSTVLTAEKVRDTHERLAKGERLADIARGLGVKYHTLYSATHGLSWTTERPKGNA